MKELWQFELDRAAALDSKRLRVGERYLGEGEPFVDWALWLLEQGVTEESVQILAVLRGPLSRWEVESWLHRAIFALGLAAPNPERFRYGRARELAQNVLAGAVSLNEGCQALFWEWIALDHDAALAEWAFYEDMLEDQTGTEIVQAAQRLLNALPESRPLRSEATIF